MEVEAQESNSDVADSDPFLNIIELLEKLYVPKVDNDKPISKCDFDNYLSDDCGNFQKIIKIIENKKNFDLQNKEKYRLKLLTPLFIVCGQHSSLYHWSSEDTIKLADCILTTLLHDFSIPTVEEALKENRCSLFKSILNRTRPWLLKETWKNYPAAVISYKWVLEKVKAPNLSDLLSDVLPTALIITDDFEIENKIFGLECLLHIINEVAINLLDFLNSGNVPILSRKSVEEESSSEHPSSEEGMTYLTYYSQDKVILKAIEPLFYYKDAEVVKPLTSTFVALLRKYYPLKNRPVFEMNEFDDMIDRFLINMTMEQRLNLREAYITALPNIVLARGLGMILHSNSLISVINEYVLEPTSSIKALEVLQAYICVCWPRMETHCTTILTVLSKSCLGLQRNRFSTDFSTKVTDIINQLNELCPNKVNPFLSHLKSHPCLVPITTMLSC